MSKRAFTTRKRRKQSGFTLLEVMVTSLLVAVAVTGIYGAISSLTAAQYHAQTADLLQRLAAEKINDVRILSDPSSDGTNGDFTDRGYPNITWSLDEQASGTTNLDQVTVTVTEGKDTQSLTTMMYIQPATGTSGSGSTSGTGGTTGGGAG